MRYGPVPRLWNRLLRGLLRHVHPSRERMVWSNGLILRQKHSQEQPHYQKIIRLYAA
ncbi:hypothetical protein AFERRI_400442 [Acidithiobacillus ferrivorans]|uniref:Uncharacterized protein n=1 Tax=Acidithiobacillus ferrivorans TaxID=160808 RepID=A0A060UQU5_9PROT|nr:hypothetical protein AFERRI_400442 [Acidithiobacillus ferrivorans]